MNTPLHGIFLRVLRHEFAVMRSLPDALNGAAAAVGRTPDYSSMDAHAIVALADIEANTRHHAGLPRLLAIIVLIGILAALTFVVVSGLRAVTRLAWFAQRARGADGWSSGSLTPGEATLVAIILATIYVAVTSG
jgi:hypothetical protein